MSQSTSDNNQSKNELPKSDFESGTNLTEDSDSTRPIIRGPGLGLALGSTLNQNNLTTTKQLQSTMPLMGHLTKSYSENTNSSNANTVTDSQQITQIIQLQQNLSSLQGSQNLGLLNVDSIESSLGTFNFSQINQGPGQGSENSIITSENASNNQIDQNLNTKQSVTDPESDLKVQTVKSVQHEKSSKPQILNPKSSKNSTGSKTNGARRQKDNIKHPKESQSQNFSNMSNNQQTNIWGVTVPSSIKRSHYQSQKSNQNNNNYSTTTLSSHSNHSLLSNVTKDSTKDSSIAAAANSNTNQQNPTQSSSMSQPKPTSVSPNKPVQRSKTMGQMSSQIQQTSTTMSNQQSQSQKVEKSQNNSNHDYNNTLLQYQSHDQNQSQAYQYGRNKRSAMLNVAPKSPIVASRKVDSQNSIYVKQTQSASISKSGESLSLSQSNSISIDKDISDQTKTSNQNQVQHSKSLNNSISNSKPLSSLSLSNNNLSVTKQKSGGHGSGSQQFQKSTVTQTRASGPGSSHSGNSFSGGQSYYGTGSQHPADTSSPTDQGTNPNRGSPPSRAQVRKGKLIGTVVVAERKTKIGNAVKVPLGQKKQGLPQTMLGESKKHSEETVTSHSPLKPSRSNAGSNKSGNDIVTGQRSVPLGSNSNISQMATNQQLGASVTATAAAHHQPSGNSSISSSKSNLFNNSNSPVTVSPGNSVYKPKPRKGDSNDNLAMSPTSTISIGGKSKDALSPQAQQRSPLAASLIEHATELANVIDAKDKSTNPDSHFNLNLSLMIKKVEGDIRQIEKEHGGPNSANNIKASDSEILVNIDSPTSDSVSNANNLSIRQNHKQAKTDLKNLSLIASLQKSQSLQDGSYEV